MISYSLYRLIDKLFLIYYWILLARVIISWVRPQVDYNSVWRHILRFIYQVTEPLLAPIRRLLPVSALNIDFSPLVAMLLLSLIRRLIFSILF
ncbi:MAG: YggT family protein [Halanaerobium sp.]|nr:YggT family protein [Halanaerobium sp.]